MSEKKITMTLEQMRAIARYELTFDEIAKDIGAESAEMVFPDRYSYCLV